MSTTKCQGRTNIDMASEQDSEMALTFEVRSLLRGIKPELHTSMRLDDISAWSSERAYQIFILPHAAPTACSDDAGWAYAASLFG